MGTNEFVKHTVIGEHISLITLDRPDRLNAISYEVLRQLNAQLMRLNDEFDTRVVILGGAGKAFCAGADLKATLLGEQETWDSDRGKIQSDYLMMREFSRVIKQMRSIPQPIIAAVNGVAAGGGLSIALASDLRVASESASFICSFTSIGLGAGDMGSSYFLPRAVGSAMAAELMLTGRTVDSNTALSLGLVSQVVSPDKLLDTAISLAKEIIDNTSPFGIRISKEALNLSSDGLSLEQILEIENRNQALGLQTVDHIERVRSWIEGHPYSYRDE